MVSKMRQTIAPVPLSFATWNDPERLKSAGFHHQGNITPELSLAGGIFGMLALPPVWRIPKIQLGFDL